MVLAVGTAVAIAFEFLARTLRAYFLDTAGKRADLELGSLIFAQALGLRMEARPGSAGTFAAQLREFESVRDFIASATLTTVMDLPFIAFFIAIVALIGGELYVVPLAAVPLVFCAGLLAQIPLARVMKTSLREGALRHGLLIESIEGIEAIKSARAEAQFLGRYEDYSELTGEASNRARLISATVVNFCMLTQQLVTVGVVVWGVHLISAGELTVGALIACVILTGRGLAPLQQVASLLVRYQHARNSYSTLQSLVNRWPRGPTLPAISHSVMCNSVIPTQPERHWPA